MINSNLGPMSHRLATVHRYRHTDDDNASVQHEHGCLAAWTPWL